MLLGSRFCGVVLERLRERFAKPYVVGSTPTHASIFNSPEMTSFVIFRWNAVAYNDSGKVG